MPTIGSLMDQIFLTRAEHNQNTAANALCNLNNDISAEKPANLRIKTRRTEGKGKENITDVRMHGCTDHGSRIPIVALRHEIKY